MGRGGVTGKLWAELSEELSRAELSGEFSCAVLLSDLARCAGVRPATSSRCSSCHGGLSGEGAAEARAVAARAAMETTVGCLRGELRTDVSRVVTGVAGGRGGVGDGIGDDGL